MRSLCKRVSKGNWYPINIPQELRRYAWETGTNICVEVKLWEKNLENNRELILTLTPIDLYRLAFKIRDQPGSLAELARLLADTKIDIWESPED